MLVRVCVINWWLDELPFVWINLPVVTCNVGEVRRSGLSRERERERERGIRKATICRKYENNTLPLFMSISS